MYVSLTRYFYSILIVHICTHVNVMKYIPSLLQAETYLHKYLHNEDEIDQLFYWNDLCPSTGSRLLDIFR